MTLTELKNIKLNTNLINAHSNNHERRKYIRTLIDYELLQELYVDKKMTSLAIKNEISSIGINCDISFFINLAKEYGISPPNSSQAAIISMNKRIETNIEKYGKENVLSKGTVSYEKRNKTVIKKYQVDNVFQAEHIKRKIAETNIIKYGSPTPYHGNVKGSLTTPHQLVIDYIKKEFNIDLIIEPRNLFTAYNYCLEKIYSPIPDIYIPNINAVIEIYGDFFHANPIIYKETDIIQATWNNTYRTNKKYPTAKDIWMEDDNRISQIKSFGAKCLILWENEIIKSEIYKEKINDFFR